MSKRPVANNELPDGKRHKKLVPTEMPSVASMFAKRDAEREEQAMRDKEAKAKFDHVTLELVLRRTDIGFGVELIEPTEDDKRGYRVVFDDHAMNNYLRSFPDFVNIVPTWQAQVGDQSVVTCATRGEDVVITVMEV